MKPVTNRKDWQTLYDSNASSGPNKVIIRIAYGRFAGPLEQGGEIELGFS